jgi:hypothetical protein
MAELVLGVGSSHGPSIQSPPERWARLADGDTRDPRFDYQELLQAAPAGLEREITSEVQHARHGAAHKALAKLTDIVANAKLDAIVVISNQHRIRPTDNHPVFGVFRGATLPVMRRADEPFDPDSRFVDESKRPRAKTMVEKPAHQALANYLIESLIEKGFDIACTDQVPDGAAIDDAFAFPYEWLMAGADTPLIPFHLSRDLPHQATPKRCYELGTALGAVLRDWDVDARVGLVSSGGLSHQIVDEELDRRVVEALTTGDADTLCGLDKDRLNRGPGTPEILNWIAVAAAMAPKKMTLVDYLPAYRSVAGTGHGLTFGYWK